LYSHRGSAAPYGYRNLPPVSLYMGYN